MDKLIHDLDPNHVSYVHRVLNLLNSAVRHLGNVHHAVLGGGQVDKRAEVHQADNLAVVNFADFGHLYNRFNHLLGGLCFGRVYRRNRNDAVVVDIDLRA